MEFFRLAFSDFGSIGGYHFSKDCPRVPFNHGEMGERRS